MPFQMHLISSPKMPKPVIIAYVPALHAGYKRLFDRHPSATIYVFGPDIIKRFDRLRKELRALDPNDVVTALKGWGRESEVLSEETLASLKRVQPKVIIPDEDVSRKLTEETFKHITIEPIFLRWDRRKMEAAKDPIEPNCTVTEEAFHQEIIEKTANIGLKSTNLYRRLGSIIFKDGEVIVEAYNGSQPTPHSSWIDGDPRNNASRGVAIDITTDLHAEAMAISKAAKAGLALDGTSMYVTDFPCPSCSKLIANSGISKLYFAKGYSVLDGAQVLKAFGVELIHVKGASTALSDPKVWVPYPEKT